MPNKNLSSDLSRLSFKADIKHKEELLQSVDNWLDDVSVDSEMAVDLKAAKFSGNKIRNLQFTLGLKKVKRNIKGSQERRIENIESELISLKKFIRALILVLVKEAKETLDVSYNHKVKSLSMKQTTKPIELTPYVDNTNLKNIFKA